jgi:hypothetical protein
MLASDLRNIVGCVKQQQPVYTRHMPAATASGHVVLSRQGCMRGRSVATVQVRRGAAADSVSVQVVRRLAVMCAGCQVTVCLYVSGLVFPFWSVELR